MTTETKEIATTETAEVKTIAQKTMELSPEAREYNRQMKIAHTLANSQIVPKHFMGKPNDIYAAVMMGSELGFRPMMALNSIVIIQGTVTLKAQTMLALVKSKCPSSIFTFDIDEAKKIVKVKGQRDAQDVGYVSTWDMEKAKAMGLSSKDNYLKQPVTMLKWRAISEVCRTVFADILIGIHATEDFDHIDNETQDRAKIATAAFSE